jgi:hypothetical protein
VCECEVCRLVMSLTGAPLHQRKNSISLLGEEESTLVMLSKNGEFTHNNDRNWDYVHSLCVW